MAGFAARPDIPGASAQPSSGQDGDMGFHVDSEAGRLRRVILHRPDLELKRLTPQQQGRAALRRRAVGAPGPRRSTTGSRTCCATAGSRCTSSAICWPRALDIPAARTLVLDRVFDEKEYGPLATDHLRAAFDELPAPELAEALVGGMTKREFLERHAEPTSVRFHVMDLDDFLLGPLPNHLFTRDTSAWIYDGVSINAMRWPARQRETVHFEAIYRHHPLFRGPSDFHVWSEGQADYPSTIEGGDVLVIGKGAVLIGMSERTTPQAVEMLARGLFAAGSAAHDRGARHAQAPGVHAPRHRDDDGRRRHLHPVRGAGHAPLVHHRAGRRATQELKVTDHPPEHMHRAIAAALGPGPTSGC